MASAGTSALRALTEAKPESYWLDGPDRPERRPALAGQEEADLVVVGGGFTGLWTSLLAKERDPGREVVLLEREAVPAGASGQNGGFMLGSLIDPFDLPLFPGQQEQVTALAEENKVQFERSLERYSIDCDLEAVGWMLPAKRQAQLAEVEELHQLSETVGMASVVLGADEAKAELRSPLFLGGLLLPDAVAMVHPGKLAWGLKRACEQLGVRVFESTPATAIERDGAGVRVSAPSGSVTASDAALATFAHPSLIRALRKWRVPTYQHILITEPLSVEQLDSLGWPNRVGVADLETLYHYTRLTKDNRMLWGHGDATLYPGRGLGPECEQDMSVFAFMQEQFARHFPQLEGIRFTHRWGGAIDTNSRGAPFFGTTHGGRAAYALGYRPGIGASRAGAMVMLDLLAGDSTPYTELPLVSGRGVHGSPSLRPYPPEPLLSFGMRLVKAGLAKERETGKRGLAARILNRAGYYF